MSDSPTLTGTILIICDTQTFDSGFSKREFVLKTDGEYPQEVKMEAVIKTCDLLDKYRVGQRVSVQYNVRGNEYKGKYFVNLQAWKITADAQAVAGEETQAAPESEDDLPF